MLSQAGYDLILWAFSARDEIDFVIVIFELSLPYLFVYSIVRTDANSRTADSFSLDFGLLSQSNPSSVLLRHPADRPFRNNNLQ